MRGLVKMMIAAGVIMFLLNFVPQVLFYFS